MTDYIKLYQGSDPTDCWKSDLVLGLIEQKMQQTFSSSLNTQWFNEIRHIIINVGSDMMTIFRLLHQKASYIDWIEKF